MKKVIIGLSGIVLAAFIIVLVANASAGDPKDTKKATTEMSKDCSKCPAAATCADKAEAKTTKPCCAGSTEAKKCDEAKPSCASKK